MKTSLIALLLTVVSLFGQAEWVEQGNQAMSAGGYESAIAFYTRAIKEGLDDEQTRILLGTAYYKAAISNFEQNKYRIAAEYYEQAAAEGYRDKDLAKNLIAAYIKMAEILEAGKNSEYWDKSIEYCNKALSLDESNAEAYSIMGGAYIAKKEYEQGAIYLNKSLKIEPENSNTLKKFGQFYLNLEMYDRAQPIFLKYLEVNPNSAYSYNVLGFVQLKQAMEVLNTNPDNMNAKDSLLNDATKNFQKAIKLDPKYYSAFANLGLTYHYHGDNDKAIKNLQKSIALNAKFAVAYNSLGLVYSSLGEMHNFDDAAGDKNGFNKAIKNFQKAVELETRYAEAYSNLAYAYAQRGNKGDNDAAFQNYHKALGMKSDDASTYYNLSELYSNVGKTALSRDCLIKAARLGSYKAKQLCQQSGISW